MSMPGAYDHDGEEAYLPVGRSEGIPRQGEGTDDEGEVYLDESYDEDEGEGEEEEDEDDDEEYDEEYDDMDDDFYDDDDDEEEEDDDDDIDLAEAERLALAADASEGASQQPRSGNEGDGAAYTLAIDPVTQAIYLVDSAGDRQDLTGTGEGEGGNGLTASTTLAALRRLLGGRFRGTRAVGGRAGADDDDDDDDDDEPGMYGFGRRTAAGLFPKVQSPIQEGVDLERSGLFGKPGVQYDRAGGRRFQVRRRNINDMLRMHEYGRRSTAATRAAFGDVTLPNSPGVEVAKTQGNVYCGQYSKDGTFFYTCAQDFKIRIYDMTVSTVNKSVTDTARHTETRSGRRSYRYRFPEEDERTSLPHSKTIEAREHMSSWTITDADLSADNRHIIWSTIGSVVGMSKVKDSSSSADSLDDDDGQVSLDFGSGLHSQRRHFGIWSLRFSADGREIVAGATSGSIHVYDLDTRRTILSIPAHEEDVNAVCFADTASSNVLVSGSDDTYLKVWDRRSLGDSGRFTRPSGVLVGHTEGLTFVEGKGDGRFIISNAKDQTCKLWDLRMMYSDEEYRGLDRLDVSVPNFDYRYGLYRKPRYAKHPHDRSLMTYTGHTVLRTLIRCHFSPEASTGQRYIYSGSYDGRVHIWNLDGTVAQILDRKRTMPMLVRGATSDQIKVTDPSQPDRPVGTYPVESGSPVVRDVSWAPFLPNIMSSAWTNNGGSVAMHEWKGAGKRQEAAV